MLTPRQQRLLDDLASRYFGVYPGIVVNNRDPAGLGRLLVRMPTLFLDPGRDTLAWARVALPYAGSGYGMWLPPQIDDEVLVAFEAGDLERPWIIGRAWNGLDLPPQDGAALGDQGLLIRTPAGYRILIDEAGQVVRVDHPSGMALVIEAGVARLEDGAGAKIELQDGSAVILQGAGGAPKRLATEAFVLDVYNNHTHPVLPGVTGPPSQPGTDAHLTTHTRAS